MICTVKEAALQDLRSCELLSIPAVAVYCRICTQTTKAITRTTVFNTASSTALSNSTVS
jgi:hypothetical protein